ncbi:hypothetical protein FOPE_05013 [Fonsecaea pedrosoi]|nr:hypothetical protein FOPE_05013 [Fonsecaea pedrosoi]
MEPQGDDMSPPTQTSTTTSRASRMSPARLARKRKADRESQKASRLKQKNYIAHLEALVKSLDASAGSEPVELLKRQGAENIEIKKALTTICRIAQTALGVEVGDGQYMGTSSSPEPMTDQANVKEMKHDPPKISEIQPFQPTKMDYETEPGKCVGETDATLHPIVSQTDGAGFSSMFTGEDADLGEFIHDDLLDFSVREPVAPQTFESSDILYVRESTSMNEPTPNSWPFPPISESLLIRSLRTGAGGRDWVTTVNLLASPVLYPLEPPEDALDGDIAITAVLRGWNAVEARGPLDHGWKVLREVDQTIFPRCGIAERMAVLRMMRLMCQCKRPGVRERLIFSPHKFAANADRYAELFSSNFRFLWPFEPEDIYYRDPDTGLYAFSEQFIGRTEDLACWTMHNDYFVALPELRGDIPGFPQTSIYTLQPSVSQQAVAVQRKTLTRPGDSQESSQSEKCSVNMDFSHTMWGRMPQVS